jgi:hypothetical protein
MDWLFRCQLHYELARCDEEIEQLQTAEQHLIKAIHFDYEKIYNEKLESALKRLRLRAELYKAPDRIEDRVAMILEQCISGESLGEVRKTKLAIHEFIHTDDNHTASTSNHNSNHNKNKINMHSLLLIAGSLLAPNEFSHVMESEKFSSDYGKMDEDIVSRLLRKVHNYNKATSSGSNHLAERMKDIERKFKIKHELDQSSSLNINELDSLIINDYKERLKLWIDLCKISRKQQLWDICRVGAQFCLLYDQSEYTNKFLRHKNSLFDHELVRNLAEVHFIYGEVCDEVYGKDFIF